MAQHSNTENFSKMDPEKQLASLRAERSQCFRSTLRDFCERPSIDIFLDSNVILSGQERAYWEGLESKVLITPEVISEVRKRKNLSSANEFVDRSIANRRVLRRDSCPFPYALDILTICAKRLAPCVRKKICSQGELPAALEDRQRLMDIALRHATLQDKTILGQSPLFTNLLRFLEVPDNVVALCKSNSPEKSFFKYPQKRLKKKFSGSYIYADEKLAATAVANAILFDRSSVIVSCDVDYGAIMKQVTDNILELACIQDDGSIDEIAFGELACHVERIRQKRLFEHAMEMCENPDLAGTIIRPILGEVLLVAPGNAEVSNWCFGEQFTKFVLSLDEAMRQNAEVADAILKLAQE